MKPQYLNLEYSRATKWLRRPTRKAARIRGGFVHPGLAMTSHAARDIGLALSGLALDLGSLIYLYMKMPFHLGILGGLIAFDIAGAWLRHCGVGDLHWRAAQIAVAETVEDQAAIRAQRPRYYGFLNFLGTLLIVIPVIFKVASLLVAGALPVLGGMGPALIILYFAVAAIHLNFTGYAFAHVRARRAEKAEENALLRSSPVKGGRANHENHVKAGREHHFESAVPLVTIDDMNGHSLVYDGATSYGTHAYRLCTQSQLDDDDLDTMVQRQKNAAQQATLYREGLRHQLEIEDSEPMSGFSPGQSDPGTASAGVVTPPQPPTFSPAAVSAVSRAATALLMVMATITLSSCDEDGEPEHVKLQVMATAPLAATPQSPLPDKVIALAAPAAPLAKRYIPTVDVVRLDTPEPQTATLDGNNGSESEAEKLVKEAWKFQSADLELTKVRDHVRNLKAGVLGAPVGNAKLAHDRLSKWASEQSSAGTFVVAAGGKLKGVSEVEIAPGIKVPAYETSEQAMEALASQMKLVPPPNALAVVLDPVMPIAKPPAKVAKAKQSAKPSKKGVAVVSKKSGDQPTAPNAARPNVAISTSPLAAPTRSGDVSISVNVQGSDRAAVSEAKPMPPVGVKVGPGSTVTLPPGSEKAGKAIMFAFGSWKLSREAKEIIKSAADDIKSKSNGQPVSIFLVGSADNVDDEAKNKELSRSRAEAVEAALLSYGIAVERIIPIGEAQSDDDANAAELANQRMVQIYVLHGKPAKAAGVVSSALPGAPK